MPGVLLLLSGSCLCLCSAMHSETARVCLLAAQTTRQFVSEGGQTVDVPLCVSCAALSDAQPRANRVVVNS